MLKHRVQRLAPVIIPILIFIFFAKLVFSNLVLARGDILLFFYPYWTAAIGAIREGIIPYWNDALFMGAPLAANSQVGFFYPLNWPLWMIFPAENALIASIVLHLIVSGLGAYAMARRCLKLNIAAGVLAGALFSLGGYLTSQVEHINQLQGLALLPWLFVVLCQWQNSDKSSRSTAKHSILFALLFALQFLSGHLQTTFITAVSLLFWIFIDSVLIFREKGNESGKLRSDVSRFVLLPLKNLVPLLLGGLAAMLLAGVQLLPALELAFQSTRQGGLASKEALSFSYHPLLITRSLFPSYQEPIFSEYVASLPIIVIILAIIGIFYGQKARNFWPVFGLTIFGLFMALGAFNPLYHLFVRLPIFDLFRAPARWLVLYALGLSLLAASGWQKIALGISRDQPTGSRIDFKRALKIGAAFCLFLMLWGAVSPFIADHVPIGNEVTIEMPNMGSWAAWLVELILAILLMWFAGLRRSKTALILLTVLMAAVLYLGTRSLPYNDPTTPEVYRDLRPPITRLQSTNLCKSQPSCKFSPGRVLSMSEIFFDVGDQEEINSIYESQLPESARFDHTVATKNKEVLSPNLPLAFGIPSVDGFDGGLLPLKNYAAMTELLLPEGRYTIDGRLREFMDEVPEDRYLDLLNVRYLITDKVGDQWHEDVFYDRQLTIRISPNDEPVEVGLLPDFLADEVRILSSGVPGKISVEVENGGSWLLEPVNLDSPVSYQLPERGNITSIMMLPCSESAERDRSCDEAWNIEAISLVDNSDSSFYPLVPGQYQLIHSGDVKIYENLDVLPRAFLVYEWESASSLGDAIGQMRSQTFDPRAEAIIQGILEHSDQETGTGTVTIEEQRPGFYGLEISTDRPALLVVTDSYYPGWSAEVDGKPAEILQTNVLFRGIFVPQGQHEVNLEYRPMIFAYGIGLTFFGTLVLLVLAAVYVRSRRS